MINKIRNLLKKIKLKKNQSTEEFEDATGEFNPEKLENSGEFDSPGYDATSTNIGDEEYFDIDDKKLNLSEKLSLKYTAIKDRLKRLNKKNFKSPSLPSVNEHESKTKLKVKEKIPSYINSQALKKLDHYLLNDQMKPKQHRVFQFSVIILLTFILGKTTALFLEGTPNYSRNNAKTIHINQTDLLTASHLNEIMQSNIFKTGAVKVSPTTKTPVITEDKKCEEATRKSNLSIQLLNTIVLQNSSKSIASIKHSSSPELQELREGEKIGNVAEIGKINRLEMIIKNLRTGTCESIMNAELKDATPLPIAVLSPRDSQNYKRAQKSLQGIKNDGNSFTIDKTLINEKMKDISSILTQARGIQINNPDGTISFKIVDIEPGGIFSHLGIKDSDVINKINGKSITSLNEIMSLFGKIGKIDKLNLEVSRGGASQELDYNFK